MAIPGFNSQGILPPHNVTRTGRKKPGYELINLKPLNEPPKDLATPPPPEKPSAPKVKFVRPKR